MRRQRDRLKWCVYHPRNVVTHRKLEKERNGFSPRLSRRSQSCQHLDLRVLVFRTVKEYISIVSNHPVYGHLLQQPQKTNTPSLNPASTSFKACDLEQISGMQWKELSWKTAWLDSNLCMVVVGQQLYLHCVWSQRTGPRLGSKFGPPSSLL